MLILYVTLLVITLVISAGLAWFAWRNYTTPGAVWFLLLMLALGSWATGYIFELLIPELPVKLFFVRVQYISIVVIPLLWLGLALKYSGFGRLLNHRFVAFLSIEPLVMLILIWSNTWHHLIWTGIVPVEQGSVTQLKIFYGPAFWVHAVYSYTLLAAGTLLLIYTFVTLPRVFRRQALVFIAGAVIMFTGNLMFVFDMGPLPLFDMSPFLFALVSPGLAWGVFRLHLLDVIPIAYDSVIENIDDGILVLDPSDKIINANPVVEHIIGQQANDMRGKAAPEVLSSLIPPATFASSPQRSEISVRQGSRKEFYELRITRLTNRQGAFIGRLLVFRNITHHKDAEMALRRRAEEMSALSSTLIDISRPHDLPGLLEGVVKRATILLKAKGANLFLADHERRVIKCVVSYDAPVDLTGKSFSFGTGAAGFAAETGQPVIVDDYRTWNERVEESDGEKKVVALISVPMIWQETTIGVINLHDFNTSRRFTRDDLEILTLFANQAAIAVENARLFEAEQRRAREAETLAQVTATVAGTLQSDEAIQRILEELSRVVPFDSAAVMLLQDGCLEVAGGQGWKQPAGMLGKQAPVPGDSPHARVVLERGPVILGAGADVLGSSNGNSEPVQSWLGVPLIVHETVIGILAVDSYQKDAFTESQARLATAFADQVAIAIENARLYAEVEQRAEELSRLYAAAQDLGSSLEPHMVLEHLARNLAQALDATSCYILELNQEEDSMCVLAEYWSPEAGSFERVSDLGRRYRLSDFSTASRAYESAEPVSYTKNTPGITDVEREEFDEYGFLTCLIVPITKHGQLLGEAEIWESRSEREFTAAEKRLAKGIAQHGASIIENSHLYQAVLRRAEERDALQATLSDISAELELPRLLSAIIQRAVLLLKATGGDLGIYHEKMKMLEVVTSYNMGKDYTGTFMSLGEGAMGQAAAEMQPVLISDYKTWEKRSEQYGSGTWHGVLAAPMLIGGKLVGALGIVDDDPLRKFTTSDVHLFSLLGQQAAIALQNARLYQSTKVAAERRSILHRVSQEIVATNLDPDAIYSAIHRAASHLMPTEAFVIALLDEPRRLINAIYLVDRCGQTPPLVLPEKQGLAGYVIANARSLVIDDILEFQEFETIQYGDPEDVRGILAVPMRLGGRVTGMLSAQSYTPGAYDQEDQVLLEMLASYAAIALDNARLFSEVQHLAITDPLTGVNNRRQLFALGQREFHRSMRFERPMSAIMIDVDHFKDVNDTFGHSIGDQILVSLSERLRQNVREIDILGRYGGDEFCIILPETETSAARLVAERLRSFVTSAPIETRIGPAHITISLGVATLTEEMHNLENLLGRADTAMYDAKQGGRDRVSAR